MPTFAVAAYRVTPTNARLGLVLSPAQAVARLGPGDTALGRLDMLTSLDGVEPGLWALDRLAAGGVTDRPRCALAAASGARAAARAQAALRLVGTRRRPL